MGPIVTITFSPCIDKTTSVPTLVPEKKLKCANPVLEPGGGGINVSRVLDRLGADTIAVFPSGGYTGKYFNHLLDEEDIASLIIETANETRENIIVLDESSNRQYRFGMPGTALNENEWKKCLEAIESIEKPGFIVASGSLPPGVPMDIYAQIARIARRKGAKFVVDTSGEALHHAVSEGVYLVKPNIGELAILAGVEKVNINDVKNYAMDIIHMYRCENIIVSMGNEGAMLFNKEDTYKVHAPQVIRKSTVGAGDSMVAGIVYSLSLGKSLREALEYGVACGTAATMNPGTELCHKKDADKLFRLIKESQ